MPRYGEGSGLYRNTVSYFGILVMMFGVILTLFAIILNFSRPSPYVGIFAYMIFPTIVAFGLALLIYGMFKESRRRRRLGTDEAMPYPRVDLNNPRHRTKFAYVTVGGMLLVIVMSFAGYNSFLFTESNTFCGKVCHSVMEPEFEAYQHSPHARVHCVECHVGSGASFYVKSKFSGVRQVFAAVLDTYQRPIPTPIHNLRPARETCEKCHWPNKFYGAQLIQIPYFRYDEQNTSDQISFMVKTGGGSGLLGESAGIHWHMIVDNSVSYVARDDQQQDIPWFKVTGSDGEERVYTNLDSPLSPEELAALPVHEVDCINCHNRPSHIFYPPDRAVDFALNANGIARDLPWVKKITAEALMTHYPDKETAQHELRSRVMEFYAEEYPEIHRTRQADLEDVVRVATDIYERSVFPGMNVDWTTYPNNIGHRNWPGCFRCHDGRHATSEGQVLSKDCTLCHTMPQRGPLETLGALPPVTDQSWHPFPLTGKHGDLLCHTCHSTGLRPSADCNNCHNLPTDAPMADMACDDCHTEAPKKLPMTDCKDCHDDQAGLHLTEPHVDTACIECHRPHAWSAEERGLCLACHDDMDDHEPDGSCGDCHEFTE